MSDERKKQPIWGFLGLALLVLGLTISCAGSTWGYALAAIGGLVLIVALFTGNVKLFG